MIGTADIFKAVVAVWTANNLNTQFNSYWEASKRTELPVLNETDAEAGHPFPYCVFSLMPPKTKEQHTGTDGQTIRQLRQVMCQFTVQTRDNGGASSQKEIAAALAAKIMEIFGGHPTVLPKFDGYAMDYGSILSCRYQADYGVKTDIDNYSWVVQYLLTTDVPVRVN